MVNTVALQEEGDGSILGLGPFYVEFASSSCVCMDFFWVHQFPPTVKNCQVRLVHCVVCAQLQ